jgi:signal transduction histidine kinase/CheY-like chemotaxis protein
MKVKPAAFAVSLLLVLLTWLSFRAIDPNAERYDRALKALDHFLMMENALHRDVLSARAGLLRDYDPLVREVKALRETINRLRNNVSGDPAGLATIDRIAAATYREEDLTEQFKSENALLQNSLLYFRLLSARLSTSADMGPLTPAVSALAAVILQLTLDNSPAVGHQVASQLNGLAAQPPPPGEAESVRALLAHGRLLHDLLPTTDRILKELLAAPSEQQLQALRTLILKRQADSRATARQFRLLLYVASLVLVGLLVQLGLRLRAGALALQRRAAFEHVIAGISTRLIDAQPHEIHVHIDRALGDLAAHLKADRAYIVILSGPTRIHRWCREGETFPAGWPDRVPTLVARFNTTGDGIVEIRNVERLSPGAVKDLLAAAQLGGWVCVSKRREDGGTIALGFDTLRSGITTKSAEVSLLRMALDAIANLVLREDLLKERARLEVNLQQARRMETVGALASGIAHNFNNIVGAILGQTEIAEQQLASDSRAARAINEMRRAAERARDLVDQILIFGRRRDQPRRPVSIRDLIAETSGLLRASLPAEIELAVREVPASAVISGQPAQLQQVILNLCNNAAQAMNQVGRVEIDTDLHQVTALRPLTHGNLKPGRYVRVAVSDAGRGIDQLTLERLFQPFFTTRVAGNGLGLATVREIVREHGGAIDVWSVPGIGSRFEVWLPCYSADPLTMRPSPSAVQLGQGETVLVVDDSSERLLADEEVLAALGYEPVGFTDAAAALAACRASPERFDASFVGHLASARSALDLAKALRKVAPRLPILLATASADEISAEALLAAGISEVVHRPLISSEIAAALARYLPFGAISVRALHS